MTVDEIYAKIAQHMVKGIMIHEQLANYYDFLSLQGYKRCHEYHFLKEMCSYRSICRYFINHHNKLVPYLPVDNPKVIPDSWYKYTRQDVDSATKKSAIKNGLTIWNDWEKETKKLYEQMYKELMNINEVASALKIKELICDVDCELKKVERYSINLKAIDYNLEIIVPDQKKTHEKYRKKEEKIGMYIC